MFLKTSACAGKIQSRKANGGPLFIAVIKIVTFFLHHSNELSLFGNDWRSFVFPAKNKCLIFCFFLFPATSCLQTWGTPFLFFSVSVGSFFPTRRFAPFSFNDELDSFEALDYKPDCKPTYKMEKICPLLPFQADEHQTFALAHKRKRSGPHIVPKLALNAMAESSALQNPSVFVPIMAAWMTPEPVLPLSTKLEFVKPKPQGAYGCSDPPTNQFEQLLADMNRFMPLSAALRVGPYTVPLNVLRFVVDKTGRFLALVTCPWSATHSVFCLFHFFKNLLHLLHQMDKDDRFEQLRKFGESQVFSTHKTQNMPKKNHVCSALCTRTFSSLSTKCGIASPTLGRMSTWPTCGIRPQTQKIVLLKFFFCLGLRRAN
jgi:hypothetical protein